MESELFKEQSTIDKVMELKEDIERAINNGKKEIGVASCQLEIIAEFKDIFLQYVHLKNIRIEIDLDTPTIYLKLVKEI